MDLDKPRAADTGIEPQDDNRAISAKSKYRIGIALLCGVTLPVSAFLLWRFRVATESATEVETVLQRILSGQSEDYSSEIKRLGGGDQTVKKVATYLHHRKRTQEERFLALTLVEYTNPAFFSPPISSGRGGIPLLLEFASDEDRKIRSHAVHLLADEFAGDPRAFDRFRAIFKDRKEDPKIRAEAVEGMSGYGVFRVLSDLVDALQDASDDVRHRAVAILSNYSNDARVVNAVKPLLKDERDDVREAARSVLESKNTPANDTGRGTR
jgi:hypothetical protein